LRNNRRKSTGLSYIDDINAERVEGEREMDEALEEAAQGAGIR